MRLVTFEAGGWERIGALGADRRAVVDLSAAGLPRDMNEMIALGAGGLERARRALGDAPAPLFPLDDLRLLAPIPRPLRNIICVGKNYHEHANEFHASGFDDSAGAAAIPEHPIFFTKAPSSVIGPEAPIQASWDPTGSTDYEGELAVVIGPGGRGIAKARAQDHVYGYTIINDVTARSLQKRHNQWFLGKSIDSFCPMGPALVTADEIADAATLAFTTKVNGEVRQSARVADLIFDIPTLIETLSATTTLVAGDIIATGTSVGVGIGFDPPRFLTPGDRVEIAFEGIGTLANPVA